MSDYSKSTNFTAKDTLPSGNSGKIVKGTEIDIEFTNIASAIVSKADISSPNLLGVPTAPTATTGSNTTQIATTAFVLANGIPSGLISLWSGSISSIPAGWYLCNGSNSTPDLRNKFVIGAYSDNAGVANTTITGSSTLTGGTKDAITVSHTHTATSAVTDPGHNHTITVSAGGLGGQDSPTRALSGTSSTSTATTGITVATSLTTAGSDGTNQNLPPYYALAYIMKA